jgi:hypothetical protein
LFFLLPFREWELSNLQVCFSFFSLAKMEKYLYRSQKLIVWAEDHEAEGELDLAINMYQVALDMWSECKLIHF